MEHLHHFDLAQDPFQNEPDLRFLCASETHRSAQLRVDRALRQNKGFVVLAGEGGTGKSLLARCLFEELEEEMFEASLLIMMQGTADAVSVLRRFCAQLGLEDPPRDRPELLSALYEQFAIVREDGRHAVLIIDDAHVLGRDAMTEIAGLLNLEYEDRRLLSLLLVGLPELDEIVASVPSLAERVDVHVRMQPLSEGEAAAYLAHRVQVAGGNPQIFEAGATKAVFTLGRGRPRRMNALADNALFEAFLAGRKQISEQDVRRAGADLSFEPQAIAQAVSAPALLAPVAPAVPSAPTPLAAVAELAFDLMDSVVPTPAAAEPEPHADLLIDDLANVEAASMSSGNLDLASRLGKRAPSSPLSSLADAGETVSDLQFDSPLSPEDFAADSFPSFSADNTAGFAAEATRLALPYEDSLSSPGGQPESTETDEIDDLFVELLDD